MRWLAAIFVLVLAVAARAQPGPGPQPKVMPYPPELDGSLATSFVVPFGLPRVSFSADLHTEIAGTAYDSRQIFIPYRERLESRHPGVTTVTILYTDLLVGYTFSLTDKNKQYLEVNLRDTMLQASRPNNAYSAVWTVTLEGEDVDDGLVRTRYHVHSVRPNGDSYDATVWVAKAYNLIVQNDGISTVGGVARPVRTKWSNIRVGPQDPALFYPPSDFKRFGTGLSPTGMPRTDWGVQP